MNKNMQKTSIADNAVFKTAMFSLAMMFFVCILFGMAPFGDNTFLTGDLNSQYINYFAQMRSAFLEGDGIFYSLQKSLGGSMFGIIAYYTASPFVLLYVLVHPYYYGLLTTVVVAIKVVLICSTMAFFLSKKLKTQDDRVVLLSLAYGFCGFVFIYMQNIMWHDVIILLPIVCYGVDVLIEKKRPFVYIFALFAAIFVNFYIAYMVCIFVVLYFFYNLFLIKKLSIKAGFAHCVRFATASLLGGLMSAAMLLPALADIMQSKGIGIGEPIQLTTEFEPWKFAARLLPFGFDWNNLSNDLPNVYAGVITIMLVIAFFTARYIGRRRKVLSLIMLALLFLSMWSTDLMLIFHGFTEPVWFTHRHSFLFVFFLCYLAATVFVKGKIYIKGIVLTILLTGGILACRFLFEESVYTTNRLLFTVAIISITATLLVFHSFAKRKVIRETIVKLMVVALIAELLINIFYIQVQFEQYPNSTYQSFIVDNTALLNSAEELEGNDDYRVEKNFIRSLNDSFLLDYYGIAHFGSTQDTNAFDFINRMDLSGVGVPTTEYRSDASNIFSDSVVGIKYLLVGTEEPIPQGYVSTGISKNGIELYKNPYAFPIVFLLPEAESYDTVATDDIGYQYETFAILGGNPTPGLYDSLGEVNLDAMEELSQILWENSAEVNLSRGGIYAAITSERDGMAFVSIPYSEYLNVTVNAQPVVAQSALSYLVAVPITAGENIIEVTYCPPMLFEGIVISEAAFFFVLLWMLVVKIRDRRKKSGEVQAIKTDATHRKETYKKRKNKSIKTHEPKVSKQQSTPLDTQGETMPHDMTEDPSTEIERQESDEVKDGETQTPDLTVEEVENNQSDGA